MWYSSIKSLKIILGEGYCNTQNNKNRDKL